MSDDGYGKYRKMLKMGIPRQQVNASMLMDGKDPNKFVEQDPNEGGPPGESAGLDLVPKGDVYDKYRKMLKCGLPMGAAMQAMAKDGVDPSGFSVDAGASTSPAPAAAAAAPSPSAASAGESSEEGGGFLSELKSRAGKKGDGEGAPAQLKKPISSPPVPPPKAATKAAPIAIPPPRAAPIAIPPPKAAPIAIPPPKAAPIPPCPSPQPVQEKSVVETWPISSPPREEPVEEQAPAPVHHDEPARNVEVHAPKATPIAIPPPKHSPIPIPPPKAAPIAIPAPKQAAARPAPAASDSALNGVYEQIVAEDQQEKSSPTSAKPKWTPPAPKQAGNDDWKSLMANNRIKAAEEPAPKAPEEPKLETTATRIDEAPSPLVETKKDSPPMLSQAQKASPKATPPPGMTAKSSPSATAHKSVSSSTPPGITQKSATTASPKSSPAAAAAKTPVPTFATNPVKPAASTLKKRHSNDWKAALAPYTVNGGSSPATPAATAAPVAMVSPPPAAALPPRAAPPPPAAAASSTPVAVNASGLRSTSDKRLPAWAVVEKPSFLVNSSSDVRISESALKSSNHNGTSSSNTPPPRSPPEPPKQSPVSKPVTAAAPAAAAPQAAQKMQPATGSIPKGFQRRFAWEQ